MAVRYFLSRLVLVVCSCWLFTEGAERALLDPCDPQQDICIAKYSSCEASVGNVNGEIFAGIEQKDGLLETLVGSRVCTCLPGHSAVNMAPTVALLARQRLECVPIEGSTCFTDGDCNIRNLDCIPLLSLLPGIFPGVVFSRDSIFPPPGLGQPLLGIVQFVANFLQLITQFLCNFNRVNTIDYKCTYPAPAKSHNSHNMGGYGSFTKSKGYAGKCKRVERNAGYPAPKAVGKGATHFAAPARTPSYGSHGSYGSYAMPSYSSFGNYGSYKAPSYYGAAAPSPYSGYHG